MRELTDLFKLLDKSRESLSNGEVKFQNKDQIEQRIDSVTRKIEQSAIILLRGALELYCSHRKVIPNILRPPDNTTLKLDEFRSDGRPHFVDGLSSFYIEMSRILFGKGNGSVFKRLAEDTFKKLKKPVEDPIQFLKHDHWQLLDAVDMYETEFGENQHIHALNRCNDRLVWSEVESPYKQCFENCILCDPKTQASFSGLLECAGECVNHPLITQYELNRFNYETIMSEAEDHFKDHLWGGSRHKPRRRTLRFIGLQRWNSLTPAQGRSVGGGYFIYRTDDRGTVDLGIVIDPGFDFVRNLFHMGFSLKDVDIVLISHAHPDHMWDFESMIHLLHEAQDKTQEGHRINVILTLAAYRRLEHIISNTTLREFMNPLVIDIRKEIELAFFDRLACNDCVDIKCSIEEIHTNYCFTFCKAESTISDQTSEWRWNPLLPGIDKTNDVEGRKQLIEIWPTRAYHDDYSDKSDSYGFIIKFHGVPSPYQRNVDLKFGYTGDTKWVGGDLYNEGCPGYQRVKSPRCLKNITNIDTHWKDVASQYADCDILLMHLGSIIEHKKNKRFEDYKSAYDCEDLIRRMNHPYLMGTIRLLSDLHRLANVNKINTKKTILIGEFGEELRGGIRTDLVKRLKDGITANWSILPVDVGLDILLHDYCRKNERNQGDFKFLCAICDKFHAVNDSIRYPRFGQDEAIFRIS